MIIDYREYIISSDSNARQALQKLDLLSHKESRALFVIDESEKLVGTITDGDIRRGLLAGKEISESITLYMNEKFRYIFENELTLEKVKFFKASDITLLPVVTLQSKILRILDLKLTNSIIPATAFIMAGGRGERLKPLTDATPKPLLKIGNKPIIEHNIDRLIKFGVEEFFISIRYLGQSIKDYLGDGKQKGVRINYVEEKDPLGTIGSLSLADKFSNDAILVMNSDILTTLDFADFYQHFITTDAYMCVASVPYNVNIPYGVLELNSSDCVASLREKPTYTYYSNAGIYFLKGNVQKLIPVNRLYNATDLMTDLIQQGKQVANFPILNYWLDVGNQEDFIKAQIDIKHLEL